MSHSISVFDRKLVRHRRDRAAKTAHRVVDVLDAAAATLLDRLDDTTRTFTRALDLGGRGSIAPALRARGIGQVVSMDLSAQMARRAGGIPVQADEEWLPFATGSFDLVVASLSLHWVNDLPGALLQIRRVLAPDGLFLASLPTLGTLQPLRRALDHAENAVRGGISPRVSPFPELSDAASLLQRAGFAMPVADHAVLDLRYRTALALIRDLQNAGESNAVLARDSRTPPRALFALALSKLQDAGEMIPMPLHMAVLTGWGPAPGQPKPAPRGSGQVSLAQALDAPENQQPN
ncbi:methyltransferase domain-containing protein [Pseudoroseomonas globiformis]|uniref:Methyltransferase domain-containing protein n=1 Tax=Teichococcus globiformis TaxID=2307229 RepID=A0ABV7FZR6_9PROT